MLDRKRLVTINQRDPTKENAREPRAKWNGTSASAEAAPSARPPLKAKPAHSGRTAAVPKAATAAPGVLKMSSPQVGNFRVLAAVWPQVSVEGRNEPPLSKGSPNHGKPER